MQNSPAGSPPSTVRRWLPEHLVADFGPEAQLARDAVGLLRGVLNASPGPRIRRALETWEALTNASGGQSDERRRAGFRKMARLYDTPADGRPPEYLLFAVQTYYALVIRLLVRHIRSSLAIPAEDRTTAAGETVVNPFSWVVDVADHPIQRLIARLAEQFDRYPSVGSADGHDLLKALYQRLLPKALRHALGEYYTPDWLADLLLDRLDYRGHPEMRLLDPACGSGTFLVRAIDRIAAWYRREGSSQGWDRTRLWQAISRNVVGLDLNPLAVMAAEANYLMAAADLLPKGTAVEVPVFRYDSILGDGPNFRLAKTGRSPSQPQSLGEFDRVAGNPPWIAWDHLPEEYRELTKPLWRQYGLFNLSGNAARHGGGKKDLSMLMLYAAADRYLTRGGRLGFVVTQTLLQSKGAGDGFRRFRLGDDGPHLAVLHVDDMVDIRPFDDAANWTATITVEKGRPTEYPVPYTRWSPGEGTEGDPRQTCCRDQCTARPVDPDRISSPWVVVPEGFHTDPATLVGPSDYRAHLGANSGGANGVYWIRPIEKTGDGLIVANSPGRGKRSVEAVRQVIEPELVYPLLRWGDVSRYRAVPSGHILLSQDTQTRSGIDPAVMHSRYPQTLAYLKRFEELLLDRAAYRRYQGKGPFYSMYNVGPYTVRPIKVVWRRMDRRINAAVVEPIGDPLLGIRPIVPQETCVLVAADSSEEAHYLCAMLNSAVVNFLVTSHNVRGGKGFGTPGMLDVVNLRRYDPADLRHQALATHSHCAHLAAARGEDVRVLQDRIDQLAGEMYGLDASEMPLCGKA